MQTPHHQQGGPLAAGGASGTIGFRLDEDHRRELGKRAIKAGISSHELARHFVLEALHESEQLPAVQDAVMALAKQIRNLQADVALTAEALLIASRQYEPREAGTWVSENLNHPT